MLRSCAPPRRPHAATLLDQKNSSMDWPGGSSAGPGSMSMASWLGIDQALRGEDDRELAGWLSMLPLDLELRIFFSLCFIMPIGIADDKKMS